MKTIGFNGSPHKKGNTFLVLRQVFEQLESRGVETEIMHIGSQSIQPCDGCGKCKKTKDGLCAIDDGLNAYMQKAYAAQGVVIGSPVYFGSVTPPTKALLDRLGYCARAGGYLLKYKVCAAVAAVRRQGAVDTLNQIQYMFMLNQAILPSSVYWNFAVGRNPGEVKSDGEGMEALKILGQNMAWLLKKIKD